MPDETKNEQPKVELSQQTLDRISEYAGEPTEAEQIEDEKEENEQPDQKSDDVEGDSEDGQNTGDETDEGNRSDTIGVDQAKNEKKDEDEKPSEDEEKDVSDLASERVKNRFKVLTDRNKKLERELEDLKQKEQKSGEPDDEDKLIEERLAKLGYMKKSDFEAEREKETVAKLQQEEEKAMLTELDKLAKEFGGLFDRKEVIKYMRDKKVPDPRAAFFALNYHELEKTAAGSKNTSAGYEGMAGKASGNSPVDGHTARFGEQEPKTANDVARKGVQKLVDKYLGSS